MAYRERRKTMNDAAIRRAPALFALIAIILLPSCGRPAPTPLSEDQRGRIAALAASMDRDGIETRLLGHFNVSRHPIADGAAIEATAGYIEAELASAGCTIETQDVEIEGPFTMRNIIGRRAGADPSLPPIVMGAHYDTVEDCPGANDNGSACASLLEIARVLGTESLERDVIYAFFAFEEEGLAGSRAWIESLAPSEAIDSMISLETIGFTSEAEEQIPLSDSLLGLPTTGDFIGVFGSNRSTALVLDFLEAAGIVAPDLPVYAAAIDSNLGSDPFLQDLLRSDHAPFWSRGVPALMVTDTANLRDGDHYHQATDTAENLDFDFILRVARAALAVVCIRGGVAD
jgi:aminopeptidase YwaD